MILDRLENAGLYCSMSPNIAAALEYLRRTDFSQVPVGRHEVDGDRVFAIVQRYRPKPLTEILWEAHRRYADIQYVSAGQERIGYTPLHDGLSVRQPYDAEKDIVFFNTDGQLSVLSADDFAIYMPTDVHAPCLATDAADAEVCKVVMKCRVE